MTKTIYEVTLPDGRKLRGSSDRVDTPSAVATVHPGYPTNLDGTEGAGGLKVLIWANPKNIPKTDITGIGTLTACRV